MSVRAVLGSALVVSSMTLLSRIAGLVRDLLLAWLLGASGRADAFVVAMRLPNLFRRLFAEGAFANAFVPLMSRQADGTAFARQTLSILLALVVLIVGLGEIFMVPLVRLVAGGLEANPAIFELAVHVSAITFPLLACMALVAFYGSLLNLRGHFAVLAVVPVLLNIFLIVAALVAAFWQLEATVVLAGAAMAAGVVQVALVLAASMRAGWRIALTWPRFTKPVRTLFLTAAPIALIGLVAQANTFIGTRIASSVSGAISHLYYAERLWHLPLGVIGVALGVVLLPTLSRYMHEGNEKAARTTLARAMEAGLLLAFPAACGLAVLALPLVDVLFTRGSFLPVDAQATAAALQAFAPGLPAHLLVPTLAVAFFARRQVALPLWAALGGVSVNLGVALTLFPILGTVGIAWASTAAGWTQMLCLLVFLRWKNLWHPSLAFGRLVIASLLACAVMVLCLLGLRDFAFNLEQGIFLQVGVLCLMVGAGLGIYVLSCHCTRILSVRAMVQRFLSA